MKSKARKAIGQLAKEKKIPEEQIIMEIEAAIAEGLRRSKQNGNAAALGIWNRIPKKGEAPTAEEFVEYFCDMIKLLDIEKRGD